MPKVEQWDRLPKAVRLHLIDRMHNRSISLLDLNQLRKWMETDPIVPEGEWFKDFGSFKLCGKGAMPKTFLIRGQVAHGQEI